MFRRKRTSGIPTGRLVIVNTKDSRSLVGWIVHPPEGEPLRDDDALVLRDARLLPTKEKILGSAHVPAMNVSWIQGNVPAHLIED